MLERDSALESEDFSQPKTTSQMHHLAELSRVRLKQFGTGCKREAKHNRATGEGLSRLCKAMCRFTAEYDENLR